MLEFRVLGSSDLRGPKDEEIGAVLAQPKRLALLTYLAVATPRGLHRRDKIVALFWPELDQEHARNALSQALHFLRRSMGEELIVGRGTEEVGLDFAQIRCDVAEFEDALEDGDPDAALEFYRGDLLEGFFLSECPDFEQWLEGERVRLRERAAGAAWSLAYRQIEKGQITEAERTARRALSLVCTDENEVCSFIEAIAEAGDRAAAIQFYEKFAARLQDELDLEPAGGTRALVEKIRASGAGAPESLPPDSPHAGEPSAGLSSTPTPTEPDPRSLAQTPQEGGPGATPATDPLRPSTWRKTTLASAIAFALLLTGAIGYMGMRIMGIGPVGTLWSAGVLDPEDRIVLADFQDNTGDLILRYCAEGLTLRCLAAARGPGLAHAVTALFRVDLSQSRTVKVADEVYVADVLRLMERDPSQPLDLETAREVAIRAGLKAVIGGEVHAVGSGFVLSVRLVVAESGEELVSLRETADDPDAVIPAVERLSRRMRERIGESLKAVRQTPPLSRVRTTSLEALKRWTEGARANGRGDFQRCVTLMTDAIALDTLFGAAYRHRGGCYSNMGRRVYGVADRIRAFELRDRMTDLGRAMTEGSYYQEVTWELEKAVEVYEAYLDLYPDVLVPLNNLALTYYGLREYARSEEVLLRLFEAYPTVGPINRSNLYQAQFAQGKLQEAEETLRRWEEEIPDNDWLTIRRVQHAGARLDYGAAQAVLDTVQWGSAYWRSVASWHLASLAQAQGKLGEAERHFGDVTVTDFPRLVWSANLRLLAAGDTAGAVELMEDGLASLDSLASDEQPHLDLAEFYARAGRPDRARELLAEWDRVSDENEKLWDRVERRGVKGLTALAEGRPEEAIHDLRFAQEQYASPIFYLPELGWAFQEAGYPDSALVRYEQYLNTPNANRLSRDALWLPIVYERMAALYEERGEVEKAVEYYGKFIDLWKECDPELRPRVAAAERAVARLQGGSLN